MSNPDPLQEFYMDSELFEDDRYASEDDEVQLLEELGF